MGLFLQIILWPSFNVHALSLLVSTGLLNVTLENLLSSHIVNRDVAY